MARRRRSLSGLGAFIESPYSKGVVVGVVLGAVGFHILRRMRKPEHRVAAPVAAGSLPPDALVVPFKSHNKVVQQTATNAAQAAADGNAAVVPVAVPVATVPAAAAAPAVAKAVAGLGYGYNY